MLGLPACTRAPYVILISLDAGQYQCLFPQVICPAGYDAWCSAHVVSTSPASYIHCLVLDEVAATTITIATPAPATTPSTTKPTPLASLLPTFDMLRNHRVCVLEDGNWSEPHGNWWRDKWWDRGDQRLGLLFRSWGREHDVPWLGISARATHTGIHKTPSGCTLIHVPTFRSACRPGCPPGIVVPEQAGAHRHLYRHI